MNCKHCGSKLGLLERWRYGDFCSQGHKDDFATDLIHLNDRIVNDLGGGRSAAASNLSDDDTLEFSSIDIEELPPPPEAEFVQAPDSEPISHLAKPEEPEAPPPAKAKADQWSLFAKVAEWAELPVSVRTESQKKQLRFVWVAYGEHPTSAPNGSLLAGEYPASLPHPELRRWQAQLQMAVGSDPSTIVEALEPQTMEPQTYWLDEEGWRWIPDEEAVTVPGFEPVLEEYPVCAPWEDWTVGPVQPLRPAGRPSQPLRPAAPGAPLSVAPRTPSQNAPRTAPPAGQPMPRPATAPPQAAQRPQAAQPFQGPMPTRAAQVAQPVQAPRPVTAAQVAPPPAAPVQAAPPQVAQPYYGPQQPTHPFQDNQPVARPSVVANPASFAGQAPIQVPVSSQAPDLGQPQLAWPGGPSWSGGMSAGAPPRPQSAQPWSTGLVWQELPPPLFNALVDPSHSVRPVNREVGMRHAPVQNVLEPWAALPHVAPAPPIPTAVLVTARLENSLLRHVAPAGADTIRRIWQPRTDWRRMLMFPQRSVRLRRPGIPMRAVPPLKLRPRSLTSAIPAAPILYSGRWID